MREQQQYYIILPRNASMCSSDFFLITNRFSRYLSLCSLEKAANYFQPSFTVEKNGWNEPKRIRRSFFFAVFVNRATERVARIRIGPSPTCGMWSAKCCPRAMFYSNAIRSNCRQRRSRMNDTRNSLLAKAESKTSLEWCIISLRR